MKKVFILSMLCGGTFIAKAQNFAQLTAGSIDDANKYATEYLKPFGESEIYNLSRGWFSTAKAHKKLGFDVSINAQFALIPSSKESFVFNNADYNTFKLKPTGLTTAVLPTFMGGNSSQAIEATATVGGQSAKATFTAPAGIGEDLKKNISFVPLATPLPVAQVGIGLIKHTDLKVRYFPKTNFSDVEIGVFGVALQHEFSDYLPFIKKVPFLHLSALAGYTNTTASYKTTLGSTDVVQSPNAVAEYKINAVTLQAIASVKIAVLEVYTSVGYINGKSSININGDYTATYTSTTTPPATVKQTVKDPVSLSFNASSVTNTWGVRLNLFIFKLYADYTFAQYNGVGIGAAVSFR